ncbi:DUF3450 family protein [Limisalsivibrio acetivorans]|uniref:DUF3450 family protein n=1 Tax=Limisalsivibrio acetivorans TaxID=1304888 RepID=UPI0003B56B4F|nr:DUF3450 family protein [Limisalsivibrio acetivorans]
MFTRFFCALVLILFMTAPAAYSAPSDYLERAEETGRLIEAERERSAELTDEGKQLTEEILRLRQEQSRLKTENAYLKSQLKSRAASDVQMDDESVLKVLRTAALSIEKSLSPFCMEESKQLIDNAIESMGDTDLAMGDKLRLVAELYLSAAECESAVELRTGVFNDGSSSFAGTYLRLGSYSTYFIKEDSTACWLIGVGRLDVCRKVADAVMVLRKRIAPDIVTLPVNRGAE